MSFRLPLVCAALLAALITAAPAAACCVYNDSTLPLVTESYIKGMHRWTIGPSNHQCTDGTGGKDVSLWLTDPFGNYVYTTFGDIWVADHGWISVYKRSGGKWKVVSKNADGSVHAVIYLEKQD